MNFTPYGPAGQQLTPQQQLAMSMLQQPAPGQGMSPGGQYSPGQGMAQLANGAMRGQMMQRMQQPMYRGVPGVTHVGGMPGGSFGLGNGPASAGVGMYPQGAPAPSSGVPAAGAPASGAVPSGASWAMLTGGDGQRSMIGGGPASGMAVRPDFDVGQQMKVDSPTAYAQNASFGGAAPQQATTMPQQMPAAQPVAQPGGLRQDIQNAMAGMNTLQAQAPVAAQPGATPAVAPPLPTPTPTPAPKAAAPWYAYNGEQA